jgi:hypothetical protein
MASDQILRRARICVGSCNGARSLLTVSFAAAMLVGLAGCASTTDSSVAVRDVRNGPTVAENVIGGSAVASTPIPSTTAKGLPAGSPDFNLSGETVCGLLDVASVNASMDYVFDAELEATWRRNDFGSGCGFEATSDGYANDRLAVHWFISAHGVIDPSTDLTTSESVVRTEQTIDGHRATLLVDGERAELRVLLPNRTLSLRAFSDNETRITENPERIATLMGKLIAGTERLQPSVQPVENDRVSSAFEMSPTQVCSLLGPNTAASLGLLTNRGPNQEDRQIAEIDPDLATCNQNSGLLLLRISSWASSNEPEVTVAGLAAFWDEINGTLSLRVESIRKVSDGQVETVVTLSTTAPDSVEVRRILTSEMEGVIAKLNTRLRQPLQ